MPKLFRLWVAGVWASLLVSGPQMTVFADSGDRAVVQLEPWFVFASGLGSDPEQTRSAWAAGWLGKEGLESALDTTPGLLIAQPGGQSGRSEIMMRGGEANFTKTYVEGMEVNDPADSRGGGFQWNQLDPSLIGSLTIAGGADAARYGSDALSGVLMTRFSNADESDASWRLGGSFGNVHRMGVTLGTSQQWSTLGVRAQVAQSVEDARYPGTYFRNTSGFLKVHSMGRLAFPFSVALWGSETLRETYPDESGGPTFAVLEDLETIRTKDRGVSAMVQSWIGGDWLWKAHAGYYRLDRGIDSPGVAPGERNPIGVPANDYDSILGRWQVEQSLLWMPHSWYQASLGLGWKKEQAESLGILSLPWFQLPESEFAVSRQVWSAYLEGEASLPAQWILRVTQRLDRTTGFRSKSTPTMIISKEWNATRTRFHASYSEGFKVPGIFALEDTLAGNRDLLPEQVRSWEVSINHAFRRLDLETAFTFFSQHYRDLVDFSEITNRLENLNSARSEGVEWTLHWQIHQSTAVRASVTWMDFETGEPDEVLRHRPDWTGHLVLDWNGRNDIRFQLLARWVGPRWDSSIPTGNVRLGSYHLLDLRAQRPIFAGGTVELSVINLLNLRRSTYIGYALPGTQLQFNARWEF